MIVWSPQPDNRDLPRTRFDRAMEALAVLICVAAYWLFIDAVRVALDAAPPPTVTIPAIHVPPPSALERVACIGIDDPILRATCAANPNCECAP